MNRIAARLLGGMDDHSVHIIPHHHPTKMDVLPKTVLQIILAAKWGGSQVRPPKQQPTTFAFSSVFVLLMCIMYSKPFE